MNLVKLTLIATVSAAVAVPATLGAVSVEKHFCKKLPVVLPAESALKSVTPDKISKSAEGGITDPVGETTVYSRSSIAIAPFGDDPLETEDYGFAGVIVTGVNGDVYIKNPFSQYPTGTYLKGTVSDDKITVSLPQNFATIDYDGDTYELYAYLLDFSDDGNSMVPVKNQTLTFVKEGESWKMTGSAILGLTFEDAVWQGFGELDMRFDPLDEVAATMPDDISSDEWVVIYNGAGHGVEMAFAGEKCYLKNLLQTEGNNLAPIVGTKTETGMTFPSRQYLGINEENSYLTYFHAGKVERTYDGDYDMYVTTFIPEDNLVFTLNDDGSYSCESSALFTPFTDISSEYFWYMNLYENPYLRKNDVTDFTPADPSIAAYRFYESMFFGYVSFDIPMLNVDGMLLNTQNMYYNIYINGSKFTLYPDEYHMLTDEITDIPYNFTDAHDGLQGDITVDGQLHTFILFSEGIDKIGIQSYYVDGDNKTYYSKLVENEVTGIDEVAPDNNRVVDVTFTDITGRKVMSPEHGVYIKTVRYSDGSVKSEKIAL